MMNRLVICMLLIIVPGAIVSAEDFKPVLTGYSDLLKVADYDYTTSTFISRSAYACSALRDGNPEEAIIEFEEYGYDFIHNYPMVDCEDDPNNGVMFYHLWSRSRSFEKMLWLIRYVMVRDNEENGTSGLDCLYCRELFNLTNPRGQTLLDLLKDSRSNTIKRGNPTSTIDKVIEMVQKLGGKTAAELE